MKMQFSFPQLHLNNLFAEHWQKIDSIKRVELRKYCMEFLFERGPDCKRQVLNSVIIFLAKIVKMSWFDDLSHQSIIEDVFQHLNFNISHCFIGILILDQIIVEMTYINKGKTLIQNRRISVDFRDKHLLKVLQNLLLILKELQSKIMDSNSQDTGIIAETINLCLSLSYKCLNFEFIGVMLDDTIAETNGTHFPMNWKDTIQDLENANIFFAVAMTPSLSEDAYLYCLQCLGELGSCRISLFETNEIRKKFVHNYASNLCVLMKERCDYFCSSRLLSRNFIKIFYRFEMNFQIRSFGTKEQSDLECLTQYLTTLSEFTLMLIKSGEQHLRDTTVHILAAWNRILIELKAQEVSCEEKIKELIDNIIVEYIEQTISDSTDDNEENDDEQFNDSELNSLTQRFEVIARFCNHNIDTAFSRINDGLTYLMTKYESELKANNKDQLDIIEIRFSWTIRLISALMNLGFAPANTTAEQESECDAIIKIIEIVKLCVQLAVDDTRRINEKLELSFLAFMAMLRTNILTDPRTICKLKISEDLSDTCNEKYTRIIDKLSSEDILGIIEIFLKKMILNFANGTPSLVEENLEMFKTFVNSQGTHRFLMKLETTQDLISNHFTKYVILDKENMLEYLSGFYRILTIFWEVNDNIDTFCKCMEPCVNYLQSLSSHDSKTFIRSKDSILRIIYILNGVAQGFTTPDSFSQFFDWIYPENFGIISEIFNKCCEDKKIMKALFKLMAELLDNKTHRLKADQSSISGFILFKEISSILIDYFKFIEMFKDIKIKNDKYEEKYQFIEMAIEIYGNIVSGNFVNFSVCTYYNDNVFIDFSKIIFTLITMQDQKELISFTRLAQMTYTMIENFMKYHSELMMNHFEPELIVKAIEVTLSGLMTENESKGSCCNALKDFCTTIYILRDKISDKIKNLLKKEESIFRTILKSLLTTVIYEEHKVIWVFQKPLFPTIIINGNEEFEIVKSEICEAENNPELREKIKTELNMLCDNIELVLDKYHKEAFNSNFTRFKNALIKFK